MVLSFFCLLLINQSLIYASFLIILTCSNQADTLMRDACSRAITKNNDFKSILQFRANSFNSFTSDTKCASLPAFRIVRRIHINYQSSDKQCAAVAWSYGINRAMDDLADMNMKFNRFLRFYWKAVWTVVLPIASVVSICVFFLSFIIKDTVVFNLDLCRFILCQ